MKLSADIVDALDEMSGLIPGSESYVAQLTSDLVTAKNADDATNAISAFRSYLDSARDEYEDSVEDVEDLLADVESHLGIGIATASTNTQVNMELRSLSKSLKAQGVPHIMCRGRR